MNVTVWILGGLAATLVAALAIGIAFTLWVLATYTRIVTRIFETKPLFVATQGQPVDDVEPVRLFTQSGRAIAGAYMPCRSAVRRGVLLFCHEFSANRWLAVPYVGNLRDEGFDVFTFDFCCHGESDPVPGYEPLQWCTSHEVEDVQAAVDYLRARPDAPEGIGLFGVSKGGSAGLVVAGKDLFIKAVVTDGAFPTLGTVIHYERTWIEIYSKLPGVYQLLPRWFYAFVGSFAMSRMGAERKVSYPSVERGVRKLKSRPLLMIHGKRDAYIKKEIIQRLLDDEGGPAAELWIVKGAKHNGCLDRAGDEYRDRVRDFFARSLAGRATAPIEDNRVRADGADDPAEWSQEPKALIPVVTAY